MDEIQFIIGLVLLGILGYAAMLHGLVYYLMSSLKVDGIFSLLCLAVAAYAATNLFALFITDLPLFVAVSKISTICVIFAIVILAWFASEYLGDRKNIPLKVIIIALLPFFILNLIMPNGILWSSIDGITLTARAWGKPVMQPVNPVISWPMFAYWAVIAIVYLLILRAAYLAFRHGNRKRGMAIFIGFMVLSFGLIFDVLIDVGINKEYFYVSEYLAIILVMLMSLHLTDELRSHALNLETMVAERTAQLQQANRELESFSHSISHDLHAPLRAIKGFSMALNEESEDTLSAESHEYLQRILSNASRMQAMVDGMLDMSKVMSSELVRSEVNISLLAAEVLHELEESDPDRQVPTHIEENIVIQCDRVLVRILLVNLLSNAWKYTKNTNTPNIAVRRYICENGKNGFVVSDNGAGFDEDDSEKLFVLFQRLHTNKEYPGIGVGLATVASIVNRHNGKVWSEGRKGEGASFYVCLE